MGAGEIGGDPGHAAGAERLDPDLLERLEDRAGDLAVRVETLVQLDVVVAQAERRAIGLAAHPGHVLRRPWPPRRGKRRRLAAGFRPRLALAPGLAGAEGDAERRPVRHRPAGRGDRPLKDLDPLPAGRRHRRAPLRSG